MPPAFGYGDRFPHAREASPGPGTYDPKAVAELGKLDPRSGFLGSERFITSSEGESSNSETGDVRPSSAQSDTSGRYTRPSRSFGRSVSSRKKLIADGGEQQAPVQPPDPDAVSQLQDKLQAEQVLAAKLLEENEQLALAAQRSAQELQAQVLQVDELQRQLQEASSKQVQAEVNAAGLQRDVLGLQAQLEAANTRASHAQDRVTTLEAVCSKKERAADSLAREHASALAKLSQAERQLQLAGVNQAELEQQVRALREQVEQVQGERAADKGQLESVQHEAAVSAAEVARLEGLLRREQERGEERVQKLEAARAQLEQQLQLAGSMQAEHEAQSAAHKETAEQLQQQNDDLELRYSELRKQYNDLYRQHTELQQQHQELKAQHDALQHQLDVLLVKQEATSTECRDLNVQLLDAKRHSGQLAEQLTNAQDTGNALAEQAAQLHAELQAMHEVVNGQEAELQETREKLQELQGTMDQLQASHTQLQVDVVHENQRSKQLEVELNSAKTFLAQASEETSSMREENYSLSNTVDKLKAKLAEKAVQQQELESMQQELATAYSQLSAAEANASALGRELQQLKLEKVQQTNNDSQLQQELRAALHRAAAAEAEAEASRRAAEEAGMMTMEMQRLVDDNTLLAERLQKMELDLRELLGYNSHSLGHNNPRQKIQYHLRLKQELEELRHECIVLLRDKFHLEQCVRYLAVRARLPLLKETRVADRAALEALQPESLAPSHVYSTPVAQKEAKDRARTRFSDSGTTNVTKEELEGAIKKAQQRTVNEIESWRTPPASRPTTSRATSRSSSDPDDVRPAPGSSPAPSGKAPGSATSAAAAPVEDRIMARIAAVCTPASAKSKRPDPTASSAAGAQAPAAALKPRRPDSAAGSAASSAHTSPVVTPTKQARGAAGTAAKPKRWE